MREPLTLAVPCRTDEPELGRTLAAARREIGAAGVGAIELLVCLNGADAAASRALAELRAFAHAAGAPAFEVDADQAAIRLPPPRPGLAVAALLTRRAGKPLAWNLLRAATRTPLALFFDADVDFSASALGLLLDALLAHPGAALASAKTTCAPRAGAFERIMAAPYGVDFPNLSAQLYAARPALLPAAMPENLIEPERWLELVVGRERLIRVPAARVAVRLPGTLADFYRQRVRVEMGKVQLAREYGELAMRGAPQPRLRAALASLGGAERARLAAYLALRTLVHAIAWLRYRRGAVAGVWRQAATTKQWDGA